MTTVAESFLADLDDLSEGEEEEDKDFLAGDAAMDVDGGGEGEDDDEDDGLDNLEAIDLDKLSNVAKLRHSDKFKQLLNRVDVAIKGGALENANQVGSVVEEDLYELVVECNAMAADIENEISVVHGFVRDKYRPRFPELESLVVNPLDYARVVIAIGNQEDMTLVDLEGILPSATIMVVTVTGSTTAGNPLPPDELEKVLEAAQMSLDLDAAKTKILQFVEERLSIVAPSLSAVVGPSIASKLMGLAGGIQALSKMPACNIIPLGSKRRGLSGFSSKTALPHMGVIFDADIVQQSPPALRPRIVRLIAGKCALMARMDSYGDDPEGNTGKKIRKEVVNKIEKWQEPPPARTLKPLPVPDAEKKKRRGGRRKRMWKERFGMSDMAKEANRMQFGVQEAETLDGEGLGMLGQEGNGRLRIKVKQSNLGAKIAKKLKDKQQVQKSKGGFTSGLSSSLAFTPVQGFELENPNKQSGSRPGEESGYFSEVAGFEKVRKDSININIAPRK